LMKEQGIDVGNKQFGVLMLKQANVRQTLSVIFYSSLVFSSSS
jgi:hypothetical protein